MYKRQGHGDGNEAGGNTPSSTNSYAQFLPVQNRYGLLPPAYLDKAKLQTFADVYPFLQGAEVRIQGRVTLAPSMLYASPEDIREAFVEHYGGTAGHHAQTIHFKWQLEDPAQREAFTQHVHYLIWENSPLARYLVYPVRPLELGLSNEPILVHPRCLDREIYNRQPHEDKTNFWCIWAFTHDKYGIQLPAFIEFLLDQVPIYNDYEERKARVGGNTPHACQERDHRQEIDDVFTAYLVDEYYDWESEFCQNREYVQQVRAYDHLPSILKKDPRCQSLDYHHHELDYPQFGLRPSLHSYYMMYLIPETFRRRQYHYNQGPMLLSSGRPENYHDYTIFPRQADDSVRIRRGKWVIPHGRRSAIDTPVPDEVTEPRDDKDGQYGSSSANGEAGGNTPPPNISDPWRYWKSNSPSHTNTAFMMTTTYAMEDDFTHGQTSFRHIDSETIPATPSCYVCGDNRLTRDRCTKCHRVTCSKCQTSNYVPDNSVICMFCGPQAPVQDYRPSSYDTPDVHRHHPPRVRPQVPPQMPQHLR